MKERPPVSGDVPARYKLLCLAAGDIGSAAGGGKRSGGIAGDIRRSRGFEIRPDRAACKQERGGKREDMRRNLSVSRIDQFLEAFKFICAPSSDAVLRLFGLAAPPITAALGSRWRTGLAEGTPGWTSCPIEPEARGKLLHFASNRGLQRRWIGREATNERPRDLPASGGWPPSLGSLPGPSEVRSLPRECAAYFSPLTARGENRSPAPRHCQRTAWLGVWSLRGGVTCSPPPERRSSPSAEENRQFSSWLSGSRCAVAPKENHHRRRDGQQEHHRTDQHASDNYGCQGTLQFLGFQCPWRLPREGYQAGRERRHQQSAHARGGCSVHGVDGRNPLCSFLVDKT